MIEGNRPPPPTKAWWPLTPHGTIAASAAVAMTIYLLGWMALG